uniref:Uncharacterized protein n=1 Tax=Chromera velia CCMP2878 TaxID=1169474 RepID=A0A0G4HDC6_9ALVE|eukprot:Cvel_26495.t1-p1 / transcript=Cvel_26495.t1 / gene=Cvel_26495 / organism=Chromera_velia_CCMP2878 / gene_product=hypothetical protein / transcript_product=hypothetical protein / location=Cvel_scaffold3159:8227-14662(+) / protein_length=301 / sequence_SO=supercontig / SO=protein_coding / is_pseudo=false
MSLLVLHLSLHANKYPFYCETTAFFGFSLFPAGSNYSYGDELSCRGEPEIQAEDLACLLSFLEETKYCEGSSESNGSREESGPGKNTRASQKAKGKEKESQASLAPAILVGNSSGARLSLILAIRHEPWYAGLVLINTTQGVLASAFLAEHYYRQYSRIAREGGMQAVFDAPLVIVFRGNALGFLFGKVREGYHSDVSLGFIFRQTFKAGTLRRHMDPCVYFVMGSLSSVSRVDVGVSYTVTENPLPPSPPQASGQEDDEGQEQAPAEAPTGEEDANEEPDDTGVDVDERELGEERELDNW